MNKLSERAMLATLSVGTWSGNLFDREVTEEISEAHKADLKEAGRFSKQIVSLKFMRNINAARNTARQIHRTLTLPWEDDGTRILAASGYLHYTEQMRLCRHRFNAAVGEFMKTMPECINEAKVRLGTMFDADDYPSDKDIKAKFSFDVEIKPVPEARDFRAKLSDDAVKAIVKDIEDRSTKRLNEAMNDVFNRIYDATHKMADKLKDFKAKSESKDGKVEGKFHDTLVYNINELAELLPSLNVMGDPRLDTLRKELQEQLVEHSPEILRSNPKIRAEVARKAEAMAKKAKSFLV